MQTKLTSDVEGIGQLIAVFEGDLEHCAEERFERGGPFRGEAGLTTERCEFAQFIDKRCKVANKVNGTSADVVVTNNACKRFSVLW
ncbi:unannotated protein [freshwater metagenome]|uniref:Unannotated protein n=1 Tax=freshwater metagenome TaxID=449393 RepID=A0A6J6EC53_9ZZZZ